MKKNNSKSQQGFTLLEILVVMIIVGVLVALGINSYLSAQIKARDGARKSDLRQITEGLEMYYNDKGTYPTSTVEGLIEGELAAGGTEVYDWGDDFHDPDNDNSVYMTELPQSPGGGSYFYESSDGTYYYIFALLENENDPEYFADGYKDTLCGDSECTYVITSPNVRDPVE